jgi:hypothetical protein
MFSVLKAGHFTSIIRNRNVTYIFRRPLRRIESLAGGMVSERDLLARGIMGSVTCCWWRCFRDGHVRYFCGEGKITAWTEELVWAIRLGLEGGVQGKLNQRDSNSHVRVSSLYTLGRYAVLNCSFVLLLARLSIRAIWSPFLVNNCW